MERCHRFSGFTLIELLIVVAIIAILAAIAVPNFLEAQVRAKTSRAKSDQRSLMTAIESYRIDNNVAPPPNAGFTNGKAEWWGWVPNSLTTPVAYMTSLPLMPFSDKAILGMWENLSGQRTGKSDLMPYTYIWDTAVVIYDHYENARAGGAYNYPAAYAAGVPKTFKIGDSWTFWQKCKNAGCVIYTAGPDSIDSTVWIAAAEYDPTNGTVSFGDIHSFGAGTSEDSGHSQNRAGRNMPQ